MSMSAETVRGGVARGVIACQCASTMSTMNGGVVGIAERALQRACCAVTRDNCAINQAR